MNKNSEMIKDLCEISAILSHEYIIDLRPKLTYEKALSIIVDTSVVIFKRLEDHIKKSDSNDWQELYELFGVYSFPQLVIYLGGKHIREQLKIELTDETAG